MTQARCASSVLVTEPPVGGWVRRSINSACACSSTARRPSSSISSIPANQRSSSSRRNRVPEKSNSTACTGMAPPCCQCGGVAPLRPGIGPGGVGRARHTGGRRGVMKSVLQHRRAAVVREHHTQRDQRCHECDLQRHRDRAGHGRALILPRILGAIRSARGMIGCSLPRRNCITTSVARWICSRST